MVEATKEQLNNDLNALKDRITRIAKSDPTRYQEFYSKYEQLQSMLVGLDETDLEKRKVEIISSVAILNENFQAYMDGTEETKNLTLTPSESGRTKLKRYRFDLYSGIFEDFKKLDSIKMDQLVKLKSQWEHDKQDPEYEYSPFEISSMDQNFADILLEYHIKSLKTKGNFPTEKITNLTTLDNYKNSFKTKITEILKSDANISPSVELELDTILSEDNLAAMLKSSAVWNILTGKQFTLSQGEIRELLGGSTKNNDEESKKQETVQDEKQKQETSLVPVKQKTKRSKSHMVCVVRVPNRFFNRGKHHYKEVKVKLDDLNDPQVPFKYQDSVVSVILPEGTTHIKKDAFDHCNSLQEVHLPYTVKSIGEGAFQGLPSLRMVNLPEGLESIGDFAFWNCHSLEDPKFPSTLREIGHYGYYNCSNIKKINLPKKMYKLGEGTFEGCTGIEEAKLPEDLDTIPTSLFSGCKKLSSIQFPKNLLRIGRSAFNACRGLTTLTNLPETLEYIGDSAFHRCERLGILDIPESVKYIGHGALSYMDALKHLKLPKSLQFLGKGAIVRNRNLEELIMPEHLEQGENIFNTQDELPEKLKIRFPLKGTGKFYERFNVTLGSTLSASEYVGKMKELEASKQESIQSKESSFKKSSLDEEEPLI